MSDVFSYINNCRMYSLIINERRDRSASFCSVVELACECVFESEKKDACEILISLLY